MVLVSILFMFWFSNSMERYMELSWWQCDKRMNYCHYFVLILCCQKHMERRVHKRQQQTRLLPNFNYWINCKAMCSWWNLFIVEKLNYFRIFDVRCLEIIWRSWCPSSCFMHLCEEFGILSGHRIVQAKVILDSSDDNNLSFMNPTDEAKNQYWNLQLHNSISGFRIQI